MKLHKLLFFLVIISGCSLFEKEKDPTELLKEGWKKFEQSDYTLAIKDFTDALNEDPDLVDAYNGLGWAYARIYYLKDALENFEEALQRDSTLIDPWAGMAVVYADYPDDTLCISFCDSLILKSPHYKFSHDATLTIYDIRLLKAKSHCNIGEFAEALIEVKILDPNFDVDDIETPEGRYELLKKIEELIRNN